MTESIERDPDHPPRFASVLTVLWIVYWIALFAATHFPKPRWPGWAYEPSDKTMHFVAYFFLAGLGWLALSRLSRKVRIAEWFAVLAAYAAIDEVLQALCNRWCSVLDFAADLVGAALALAAIEAVRRWRAS